MSAREEFEKIETLPEYIYFRRNTYYSSSSHADHLDFAGTLRHKWEGYQQGYQAGLEAAVNICDAFADGSLSAADCADEIRKLKDGK